MIIIKEDFYGLVIKKPAYDGDDWITEVDVYGEGIVEYIVADYDTVSNGDVIKFKVSSKGELTVDTKDTKTSTVSGTVYEKSGNSIKIKPSDGTLHNSTNDFRYSSICN